MGGWNLECGGSHTHAHTHKLAFIPCGIKPCLEVVEERRKGGSTGQGFRKRLEVAAFIMIMIMKLVSVC